MGLWRVDSGTPTRLSPQGVPLESQLETMIEADPTILGTPLMLVGRQVPTAHGKFIDLLAVDDDGAIHVLELKKDKTPRDVVAQALDYGSWVRTLSHDDVLEIFRAYKSDVAFEVEWASTFGTELPDELNSAHRLTIVAAEVDPATERIVEYLAEFNLPINVVFFRYFVDDGRSYLARTWLMDEARTQPKRGGAAAGGTREPWNELDWYVSFGEESGSRNWDDAREHGFLSAGGGEWFSRTLRKLPIGARVFACIPGTGYVGVGVVTTTAEPFEDAMVQSGSDEARLAKLPLRAAYHHDELPTGEDHREFVVGVQWEQTRDRDHAVWSKGMFANQNSACKLRNKFTLDKLTEAFDLD